MFCNFIELCLIKTKFHIRKNGHVYVSHNNQTIKKQQSINQVITNHSDLYGDIHPIFNVKNVFNDLYRIFPFQKRQNGIFYQKNHQNILIVK